MDHAPISAQEFVRLPGVDDWRPADGAICAEFSAGSFTAAGALVSEIARAADQADHHPDVDLRYPDRVRVGSGGR